MKIGLIRCQQTEDTCPATMCFSVMKHHKGAFREVDDKIEVVGVATCGGCPGKRAVFRAKTMVKNGAEAIALSSCMSKGSPIDFQCPNINNIKSAIVKQLGSNIKIFDYTHD